jgi:CBS domain-containing protein
VRARESDADRLATVGAIMRTRIVELSPEDSLREAEVLMRMARFRTLPVVSAERLYGLLYYSPMVRWCLAGEEDSPGSVSQRLRNTRVVALMDAEPVCAAPGDPVGEAAARLAVSESGCLPVVDAAGRLLGLVTERDLLRAAHPPAGSGAPA